MKIAMVSNHATVRVAELSAALARHGHRVSLFTRCDDPDLEERVAMPEGYTRINVPAGLPEPMPDDDTLTFMGSFAQYLDAEWAVDPPDIAHAHCWMSGVATQLVTRNLGLPAVQTFQGLRAAAKEHAQLEATVARTADWVASTCTDEVFDLVRMGRARNRISVIPCGVDSSVFTPDGPRPAKGAVNRIVSLGGMLSHNDFDALVRAMPRVAKTELVIIGTEDPRLSDLAKELGVARRVHLFGSVAREDLPALLRSADVAAFSPVYEPFGAAALEAMACGLPVVAPAVGAFLDTVVHDVTGHLVPPKNLSKLAEAMNVLLRDSFLRQSFGAAGRDRAGVRYSWHRIAEDMMRIYHGLAISGDQRVMTPA